MNRLGLRHIGEALRRHGLNPPRWELYERSDLLGLHTRRRSPRSPRQWSPDQAEVLVQAFKLNRRRSVAWDDLCAVAAGDAELAERLVLEFQADLARLRAHAAAATADGELVLAPARAPSAA